MPDVPTHEEITYTNLQIVEGGGDLQAESGRVQSTSWPPAQPAALMRAAVAGSALALLILMALIWYGETVQQAQALPPPTAAPSTQRSTAAAL